MSEREDRAAWDRLTAQLRAYGGAVENVRLGRGPRGRGLFVERKGEPTKIVVPRHLMIPADQVELDGGKPVLKSGGNVTPEARDFFEAYHASIGFSRDIQRDARRALNGQHQLPVPVQDLILKGHPDGLKRFPPFQDADVLTWFINTRAIKFDGKRHLMPMLELVNHDAAAPGFLQENGDTIVEGKFENEVLVRYHQGDPWSVYLRWGFAAASDRVYSLGLDMTEPAGWKIRIRAETRPADLGRNTQVTADGRVLTIDRMLLAGPAGPEGARELFRSRVAAYKLADPDELFALTAKVNKDFFTRVLALTKGATTKPGLVEFRKAAKLQLKSLTSTVKAD